MGNCHRCLKLFSQIEHLKPKNIFQENTLDLEVLLIDFNAITHLLFTGLNFSVSFILYWKEVHFFFKHTNLRNILL